MTAITAHLGFSKSTRTTNGRRQSQKSQPRKQCLRAISVIQYPNGPTPSNHNPITAPVDPGISLFKCIAGIKEDRPTCPAATAANDSLPAARGDYH